MNTIAIQSKYNRTTNARQSQYNHNNHHARITHIARIGRTHNCPTKPAHGAQLINANTADKSFTKRVASWTTACIGMMHVPGGL